MNDLNAKVDAEIKRLYDLAQIDAQRHNNKLRNIVSAINIQQ